MLLYCIFWTGGDDNCRGFLAWRYMDGRWLVKPLEQRELTISLIRVHSELLPDTKKNKEGKCSGYSWHLIWGAVQRTSKICKRCWLYYWNELRVFVAKQITGTLGARKSGCTPDQLEHDCRTIFANVAAIKIYDLSVNFASRLDKSTRR